MTNYCENFNAIITTIDSKSNQRLITRTRCKQWDCKYCAEKNRNIWRARIIDHINNNKELDWSWFTLTAHSRKRGASSSLKNLRGAWDKLMKRIKRKYSVSGNKKIHYCRVYERHKDNSYHLHCIVSLHWDSIKIRKGKDGKETSYDVWLAKQARELKIGYYTHAANFEGQHAGYIAGYVTKYMTKLDASFKLELGRIRHIQTSQNWSNKSFESDHEWEMKSGFYERDMENDFKNKIRPIDIQTGQYITYDDYEFTYVYPPEFDHRHDKDKEFNGSDEFD